MKIFSKILKSFYVFLKDFLFFLKKGLWYLIIFCVSLICYVCFRTVFYVFKWKIFPKDMGLRMQVRFEKFFSKISRRIGLENPGTISRVQLIEMSLRNLKVKIHRTIVTIGGMAIGIGAIVFLVSIGYGLQELVISRVARLDEMKQADVTAQVGTKIKLNDETLAKIKNVSEVEDVLPVISVVGKVNYNNSITDMAVYGVTSSFLDHSAIKPYQGETFQSDQMVVSTQDISTGMVKIGEASADNPEKDSLTTTLAEGTATDASPAEVSADSGKDTQEKIASSADENSSKQDVIKIQGDSNGDFVNLDLGSQGAEKKNDEVRPVSEKALKKAVVNSQMLKVLNLSENKAVGKKVNVSFVATSGILDNGEKIQSEEVPYEIVGVVGYGDTPLMYVPFIDLRTLGIDTYSQARVVVNDQDSLASAREKIEGMGFDTTSVADTVEQVNSLFAMIRKGLALTGAVALAVASLGMFNTLTISLLERTREVGLMKAMGMKSDEVRDLFLTESMVIGFTGGIMGLLLGYLGGKLLSILLSFFSFAQGQGYLNISMVPLTMIAYVMILSLVVGIMTGIYPAKRAKKISALNALRYE